MKKFFTTVALFYTLIQSTPVLSDTLTSPSFTIGPLRMQFNTDNLGSYLARNKGILDNPICYGITHRKMIELILILHHRISENEVKMSTKRLVVEPYAFGITNGFKPVLEGNIVEERLVKHIITKYVEEAMDEEFRNLPIDSSSSDDNYDMKETRGFFYRLFYGDAPIIQSIDIKEATVVQVLSERNFSPSSDFKGINDKNVKVLCQIE